MVKFIFTKEIGRLCRWFRILGFDAVYFNEENKGTLIIRSLRENRIVVTRRRKPIDNLKVVIVENNEIKKQVKEVIEKLNLKIEKKKMFTRCIICNEPLFPIEKREIKELVPQYVYQTQNLFHKCNICKRVYWQGTHWGNMQRYLESIGVSPQRII